MEKEMNKIKRKALSETLRLLKEQPKRWTYGPHDATWDGGHVSQRLAIVVWTSNRYYGTELKFGSITIGVACMPAIFWFLFPWHWWRYRLVRAVEDAQYRAMEFEQ